MKCKPCQGSGKVGDPQMDCSYCEGTGKVPFDRQSFTSELCDLAGRYEVTDSVICGTDSEGNFFGFIISRNHMTTTSQMFDATLNVGRLWQFMREYVGKALNRYEKK